MEHAGGNVETELCEGTEVQVFVPVTYQAIIKMR